MAGCANRAVMAGEDCPKPGAVLMLQQVCTVCPCWHYASPWAYVTDGCSSRSNCAGFRCRCRCSHWALMAQVCSASRLTASCRFVLHGLWLSSAGVVYATAWCCVCHRTIWNVLLHLRIQDIWSPSACRCWLRAQEACRAMPTQLRPPNSCFLLPWQRCSSSQHRSRCVLTVAEPGASRPNDRRHIRCHWKVRLRLHSSSSSSSSAAQQPSGMPWPDRRQLPSVLLYRQRT